MSRGVNPAPALEIGAECLYHSALTTPRPPTRARILVKSR